MKHATYWQPLEEELGRWRQVERRAVFWWRDDDAVEPGARLDRLLRIGACFDVPLALAVIPKVAAPNLARCLAPYDAVTVLQHGYAHLNHGSAQEKKSEFGDARKVAEVDAELAAGLHRMRNLFGQRFLSVLVPPWNRLSDRWLPRLSGLGFCAISGFCGGRNPWPGSDLLAVNTHIDLIDWRNGRGFVGIQSAVATIVRHLTQCRTGDDDGATHAFGLLTHHLVHDEGCWAFLDAFFCRYANHESVTWANTRSLVRL